MSATRPDPTYTCDQCGTTATGKYPEDWFTVGNNSGGSYIFNRQYDLCSVGCLHTWEPRR